MRKFIFSIFVFSVFLHADVSSRYLFLPGNSWEIGIGYIDSEDHNTRGAYIPLRYALTERLELVPFGIKFRLHNSNENQLALLASMDLSWGSLEGWSTNTHLGLIWRNLMERVRITTMPIYTNKHSDMVNEHIIQLYVSSVYTFAQSFEAGVSLNPSYDHRDVDYSAISTSDTKKMSNDSWKTTVGAFIYYFFTENVNLKTGIYEMTERGISYDSSYTYQSVLYQLDWRF